MPEPETRRPPVPEALLAAGMFFFSLVISLTQNPSSVIPRTTLYFDSAHYLETTTRMYDTLAHAFSGGLSTASLDALAFHLMLDGPVLPGAGVLLFFLLQRAPSATDWQSIVIMQCFFQALCTVFVFLLTKRLAKDSRLAALAGTLWALYPAAISSCNSFLTEPLACALASGFIYFLSAFAPSTAKSAKLIAVDCFMAGLFMTLLLLLKPAFAPALGLICAGTILTIAYTRSRTRIFGPILKILFAGLGILVVLGPWLSFTLAARGTLTLLPSRRPVYNICTGLNIEGDGWGCYPTHPLALMYDDNEAALPVALALIQHNPGSIANLSLRKLTRLWNLPWNDYRYKILGLTFKLQSLLHLILVSLGLSGLLLLGSAVASSKGNEAGRFLSEEKLCASAIIIFVWGHLIYLPFEGISRYGFSAMPFLIVASVYFLQQLACSVRSTRNAITILGTYLFSLAIFLLVCKFDFLPYLVQMLGDPRTAITATLVIRSASVIFLGIAVWQILKASNKNTCSRIVFVASMSFLSLLGASVAAAFAYSDRETQGWECKLQRYDMAQRSVFVDELSKHAPDWALLMVDGDQNLPNCKFFVNGFELDTPCSLYQYNSEKYELEDWLNQFASLIRKDPHTLKRWQAVQVPIKALEDGWNRLECDGPASGAASIYGDYLPCVRNGQRMLPSSDEVSPGKFFNDKEDAFDSRIVQTTNSPVAKSQCKYEHQNQLKDSDLSPSRGVQKGDYRLFLLLGYKSDSGSAKSEPGSAKPESESVKPGPGLRASSLSRTIASNQIFTLKPQEKEFSQVIDIAPNDLSRSHIYVEISGDARTIGGQARSAFSIAGIVDKGERLIASVLPGTPRLIDCKSERTSFSAKSSLPSSTIQGGKTFLRIEMKATSAESEISNLKIQIRPVDEAQFSGHSIKVY